MGARRGAWRASAVPAPAAAMELYATHTCARRDFGRHPQFADEPAELVSDMAPQPQVLQEEYIERSPCVTTVQIAPEMSEHEVRVRWAAMAARARRCGVCAPGVGGRVGGGNSTREDASRAARAFKHMAGPLGAQRRGAESAQRRGRGVALPGLEVPLGAFRTRRCVYAARDRMFRVSVFGQRYSASRPKRQSASVKKKNGARARDGARGRAGVVRAGSRVPWRGSGGGEAAL